jgi:hypothetical protein
MSHLQFALRLRPNVPLKATPFLWLLAVLTLVEQECSAFSSLTPHSSSFSRLFSVETDLVRRSKGSNVILGSSLTFGDDSDDRRSSISANESCIKLIDPATGCEVVLVGCFHGTVSSAKDVESLMTEETTDVVALELCATRFADMQRYLEDQAKISAKIKKETPWIQSYLRMVSRTLQTRGLATGMAAAVLGGVAGLQTSISGFTPGLEFTTALQCAQSQNDGGCQVALVDQDVDETLRRIGSLPKVAMGTILKDPAYSIPHYSNILMQALWGGGQDGTLASNQQVQITRVMTRNRGAIQDLIRLTIPPLVLTQLLSVSLTNVLYGMEATGMVSSPLASSPQSSSSLVMLAGTLSPTSMPVDTFLASFLVADILPHFLVSGLILALSYILLVLPAVSVILAERDDILTSGIQAACREASSKHCNKDALRPGRVVAVLGLLHVNGVAARLLSSSQDDKLSG